MDDVRSARSGQTAADDEELPDRRTGRTADKEPNVERRESQTRALGTRHESAKGRDGEDCSPEMGGAAARAEHYVSTSSADYPARVTEMYDALSAMNMLKP